MKYWLVALVWLVCLQAGAQSFVVIHADTGYTVQGRGKATQLEPGATLKATDVVRASGNGSLFLVSQGQRYMHRTNGGPAQQLAVRQIKPALGAKSCLTAVREMGDFNAWLAGETQLALIGREWKIKLDSKLFPITEGRYFTVVVRPNGTPTQLALPARNDSLIFPASTFVTSPPADLQEITQRGLSAQLYYYDTPKASFRRVTSFTPYLVEEGQLVRELKQLLKANPKLNELQRQLLICEYMSLVYARPELGRIKALMRTHKL